MIYKRVLACMAGAAVLAGLTACKKDDEIKEYSEMLAADDMVISTGLEPSDKGKSTTETTAVSGTAAGTVSTSQTTAVSAVLTSKSSAAASSSKKVSVTTQRAGNISINNSNNVVNNNNNSHSGGSANTEAPKATEPAIVTTQTEIVVTEPVLPEDVEKFVDFGAGQISGDGYTFDGAVLNIFSPGTYQLSGQLYGVICVNVGNEDKVKLRLNGVSIENAGAPCIQIENADKVTINSVGGFSNSVICSSTNAEYDAAIFSKDDLKIKGEGSLYVSCDNEHGISCNNDLEISECQLTVDAEKTGINSHKSITILSGNITASGDNCGIRCRDYIEITDGCVTACGGKKVGADRGGIISDSGNLAIQGGTVIALGMNQTVPYGQTSALFSFPSDVPKENTLGVSVGGVSLASVTPNKKYRCVLVSSPVLGIGAVCDVWLAGTYYDNFEITDPVTQAALDGIV
ncbi:MAG: carbohydrate-binding domain-containing protein [Ruminococcus sp.]